MVNLVAVNDVAAMITAGIYANVYGEKNMGETVLTSGVISIVSRMLAQSEYIQKMDNLDQEGANIIVVAILGALNGYRKRAGLATHALKQVSIDVLSERILRIFYAHGDRNLIDTQLFNVGSAPSTGNSTNTTL